jgi:NAD(P)-dependent dehydrogenase (short-subunit alcohol dehydrogenase family)
MAKTVLITGCSTGFGRVTAEEFVRQGWHVAATMRTPVPDILGAFVTRLDVQDPSSIQQAVDATVERFGSLDVLINNAGFGLFGVFEETPRERLKEQLDVNLFGVMDVTRAVLPQMRRQRSGVIMNVSSGAGVFTLPMLSGYCASKFALEGFSEALWYELVSLGIHVKLVEPGGVVSTRFGERSASEAGKTESIPDYAAFVKKTLGTFDELRRARGMATAESVAQVVYAAATDGTDQLRYVATPDIAPLLAKRRESSEQDYIAFMHGRFG